MTATKDNRLARSICTGRAFGLQLGNLWRMVGDAEVVGTWKAIVVQIPLFSNHHFVSRIVAFCQRLAVICADFALCD